MIKWTSTTKDNIEKEIFLANLISEEGLQNTCRQIRPYPASQPKEGFELTSRYCNH